MSKKNSILIVDDLESNRILLEKILSKEGYKLITCAEGNEAVKMALEEDIDLVLLDIMMPKKDGFMVFEELKANSKSAEIPVIFITVLTNDQDLLKAFKMGAVDYITKPFTPTEVRIKIKTQIELHNSRKLIAGKSNGTYDFVSDSHQNTISAINEQLIAIKKQIKNLNETALNQEDKNQLRDSLAFSIEVEEMLQQLVGKTSN
ncbi:MAG: response regulator [Bacteroidales bacterium]|nr:response regulator [Bacteroidales bacterium]